MAYVIGSILFIIVLMIIGLIIRKKIYDEVDRYEGWKLDIMNRNIAAELSRIKNLNLSGETQEKFESWKERWEFIVTKELPDMEELLFDAEESADKYRIPSAKKSLRKIEQNLQVIEKDIDKILQELDELLESEETSRKEVEQHEPAIKTLRKTLAQNRFQYGKADVRFEVELDELQSMLRQYHELVESGNYIEAKQQVIILKSKLETLEIEMEEFPAIYKACKHDYPAQLDELYKGLMGMKEEGYRVEHLGFEKEIQMYQQRLLDCVLALEKGNMKEPKQLIDELDERIKDMYQLLEKEAIAKKYMEAKVSGYQQAIKEIAASFDETKQEVETLKNTYYFSDSDMEKYLALDQSITKLKNQMTEILEEMNSDGTAHSELRSQLDQGLEQLTDIENNHELFKKQVKNLRKDELEAKEKLLAMREQIYNTNKKMKRSNIPGVPGFIWNMMDEALEKNDLVLKALEKQPLDIAEVQQALSDAKTAVDYLIEQTDIMLEQAYLTEQVIQYANRYRSNYPALASKLKESERLFRAYEYELALEKAAEAVEDIEPGALKRIEEYQTVIS